MTTPGNDGACYPALGKGSQQPKKTKRDLTAVVSLKRKRTSHVRYVERAIMNGRITVEEDAVDQIFSNMMSPYMPTSEPSLGIAINDTQLFSCAECGDSFLFESSLKQHVRRCSVKICVWRPANNTPEIFYNRCSLLGDLRKSMISGATARITLGSLNAEETRLPDLEPKLAAVRSADIVEKNEGSLKSAVHFDSALLQTSPSTSAIHNITKSFTVTASDKLTSRTWIATQSCFSDSNIIKHTADIPYSSSRSEGLTCATDFSEQQSSASTSSSDDLQFPSTLTNNNLLSFNTPNVHIMKSVKSVACLQKSSSSSRHVASREQKTRDTRNTSGSNSSVSSVKAVSVISKSSSLHKSKTQSTSKISALPNANMLNPPSSQNSTTPSTCACSDDCGEHCTLRLQTASTESRTSRYNTPEPTASAYPPRKIRVDKISNCPTNELERNHLSAISQKLNLFRPIAPKPAGTVAKIKIPYLPVKDPKKSALSNGTKKTTENKKIQMKSCENSSNAVQRNVSEETATESNTLIDNEQKSFVSIALDSCPECDVRLSSEFTLKDHFSAVDSSTDHSCSKCQVSLPSSCSLKCHEKIHNEQSKCICPECGVLFLDFEIFMDHLHLDCFHAYLSPCYECPQCSSPFPTTISLEVHILNTHIKKVYKCVVCNIACFSAPALNKHRLENHQNFKGKGMVYQMCELCPGRLITQSYLLFHVHQHAEETKVSSIKYTCHKCKVFEASLETFKKHKAKCTNRTSTLIHLSSHSQSESPNSDTNSCTGENTTNATHATAKSPIKIYQEPASQSPESKIEKLVQVNSISRPCHKCGMPMQPFKKSYACIKCNRNLSKLVKKMSPTKTGSDDVPEPLIDCPLCNVGIKDDFKSVKDHFAHEHKNVVLSQNLYRSELDEMRKSTVRITKHTKNTQFKCEICQMETNNEEEFRQHVVTHKPDDGPAFQCLECGKCYVVKPSLQKHLLLNHKMKGVDEYLRETGQEHCDDVMVAPVKEDQCEVCYTQFETSQELTSHLRTHGLAFLKNMS